MVHPDSVVLTRDERSPKSQDRVTGVTEEAAEKLTLSWTLCSAMGFSDTAKSTANTSSARVHPHSCAQRGPHEEDEVSV